MRWAIIGVWSIVGCGGDAFELATPGAHDSGPIEVDSGSPTEDVMPRCVPKTCVALGMGCGSAPDWCGGTLVCGPPCISETPDSSRVDASIDAPTGATPTPDAAPDVDAADSEPNEEASMPDAPTSTDAGIPTSGCISGVGCCAQWGCFTLPGVHGPELACCNSFGPQPIVGGDCTPVPGSACEPDAGN